MEQKTPIDPQCPDDAVTSSFVIPPETLTNGPTQHTHTHMQYTHMQYTHMQYTHMHYTNTYRYTHKDVLGLAPQSATLTSSSYSQSEIRMSVCPPRRDCRDV